MKDHLITINNPATHKIGCFCSNCGRQPQITSDGKYICKHCSVALNYGNTTHNDEVIIEKFSYLLSQKGWPQVVSEANSIAALREAHKINKQQCQQTLIQIKKHSATGKVIIPASILYHTLGVCKCHIRFVPAAEKEATMALINLMPTDASILVTTVEALIAECNQIFDTDRAWVLGGRLSRKVKDEHITTIILCGDYAANRNRVDSYFLSRTNKCNADVDVTNLELIDEDL